MNSQIPLTDDAIRAAVVRRATSGSEGNLRERVLEATAVVPQARGWRLRWGQGLAMPERRTSLVLAIAVLLLLAAAIGVAIVGRLADDTAPAQLGRLAYISDGDLYVAGPAGQDGRLVWDIPPTEDEAPLQVTWLDGDNVLLQTYGTDGGWVHAINVITGENRILHAGSFVALSPDRRRVAIATVDDTSAQAPLVRIMEIETGATVRDIAGTIRGYPAAWSPDGRTILGELPDAIERIDVATGERTTIAQGLCCGLSQHWPQWSPDGLRVVYVAYHEPSPAPGEPGTVPECAFRCGTIWTVAAAGGEPARVTPEIGSEILPAFSPDGRWIAYVEESTRALTVISSDGSETREIGQFEVFSWDEDSSAFTALSPHATLWHVPLDGPAIQIQAPPISEFARQVLP